VRNHRCAANGGVRLAWEEAGEGPPVLLIHGLGYDRRGWGPLATILAERFRVVVFDNRGVGESDAPPGPYSIPQMAADAAAILDYAQVERVHLVGTSLGGMIAQELALRRPERISALVLSSTTPGGAAAFPIPPPSAALYAAFADEPSHENLRSVVENALSRQAVATKPALVEEIFRYRLAHPPRLESWLAQAAAGSGFSALAELPTLEVPTLVIHGADDNVVDPRNSTLLAQAIPGAELVLMPDTGHLGFWERPFDFAAAVGGFLERQTINS
jgi:3-oxoadipate enol-lactonase